MVAVAAGALMLVPLGLAGTRRAPSCGLVSVAAAKAALGIPIVSDQKVTAPGNAGLTLCWYGTAANPQAVQLAFRASGAAQFAHDQKVASVYAKNVAGLGGKAFYNSAGGPTHTSLYVLKGKVEVTILAFAPLAKTETFARKVVAGL